MLVLTRKRDESIMIGDDIEVKVLDISGEQVKIGVRAPRAVTVHRLEVYQAIQRENIEAAQKSAQSTLTNADAIDKLIKRSSSEKKPAVDEDETV